MRFGWCFGLLVVVSLVVVGPIADAAEKLPQDAKFSRLSDVRLTDSAGHSRLLGELLNKDSATLFAFVGAECPVSRLYVPVLMDIADKRASSGLSVIALDPNFQDDLTDIAALDREFKLPFPILRDADAKVADMLGITRTPEVVLLDKHGRVRYRGRIDNQYQIGVRRDEATATPLADAIDAVLAGEDVALALTKPIGCLIGRRPEPDPNTNITYTSHIAALMHDHCVECHRPGQIGPFSLTSYEDVAPWAPMLQEVIHSGRMPPWLADPDHGKFRNDPRLTVSEKRMFDAWVAAGCPKGDPDNLPELPKYPDGWRIPEPDLVIAMAEEAFAVPAEGVVDYQYFRVDPGFTEDKYLVAAEPQPGNPAVVHHIIVHVVRADESRIRGTGVGIGYAPGMPPLQLEPGQAMKIPAGSKLIFELHYTPNGTAASDLSRVGLKFCPEEKVRQLVHSASIVNHKFKIPPGDESYVVQAAETLGRDRWLICMTPHMHFRGAAFKYEAIYPNGDREILLNVPRYDFNWQLRYELARAKKLPAGTTVRCTAIFDNSAGNPANPDPTDTVTWGQQSWEEMMIGFALTVPNAPPVVAPRPTG